MREVFWTVSALDDLEGIIAYMAAENPQAALGVVDKIEKAAGALSHMATGRQGRVKGTYEKPVTGLPHIIAYAVETRRDGTERIVILRVIHRSRKWPKSEWPK